MEEVVFRDEWAPAGTIVELRTAFTLPEAGWVAVEIAPLLDTSLNCSEVFDPMVGFITWLEAIVEGAGSATWVVDEEGILTRLQFYAGWHHPTDNTDLLFAFRTWGDGSLHLRGIKVRRRQFVQSVYQAFRAMADSPDYSPREWDVHPDYATLDDLDDEAYGQAMQTNPYSGTPLQGLRSPKVEAYLNQLP